MRESTFNPNGDVIPMLGRSYSTLSREKNRVKPIVVNPSATTKSRDDEDFYDRVYDDKSAAIATTNMNDSVGPEVEEIYDDAMDINPDEIYDAVASVNGEEENPDDGSFNDSFESSGDESIYEKADLGLDIHF